MFCPPKGDLSLWINATASIFLPTASLRRASRKEAFLSVTLPSGPSLPRLWNCPSKCVSGTLKTEPEKCNTVERSWFLSCPQKGELYTPGRCEEWVFTFVFKATYIALYFTSGKKTHIFWKTNQCIAASAAVAAFTSFSLCSHLLILSHPSTAAPS